MPVATDLRSTIIDRQREGATITQIAQELGVSRPTVYKALTVVDDWERWVRDKSINIRRLAYNAVERGLNKGDARLGLEWLKLTDFAAQPSEHLHLHGDVSLVNAVGFVPSTTSITSIPSTASSPGTLGPPTEAPAKPGAPSVGLSSHTNFSQFSDAQLEAELARRRAARSGVIEAEVVR